MGWRPWRPDRPENAGHGGPWADPPPSGWTVREVGAAWERGDLPAGALPPGDPFLNDDDQE